MQMLKSRRLVLLRISPVLIFALGVATSLPQEKTKITGKRFGVCSKRKVIEFDDTKGHILFLLETEGVDAVTGAKFIHKEFWDYVKGNGTHWGYAKVISPRGEVAFTKNQGKITTTLSPKGEPFTTFKGTWSLIKGTGKYENAQGGGTYKGKVIEPGVYTYEWEGEYTTKK